MRRLLAAFRRGPPPALFLYLCAFSLVFSFLWAMDGNWNLMWSDFALAVAYYAIWRLTLMR